MRPSQEAPQQHKQPSRKGKKAWRKNVNVTDVQVGLEEAREEVIKGLVPSIEGFRGSRTGAKLNTVVSLPKNLLIPSSPWTLKARRPSKSPTTKFTSPLKQIKSLLNALPFQPYVAKNVMEYPMGYLSLAVREGKMVLPLENMNGFERSHMGARLSKTSSR